MKLALSVGNFDDIVGERERAKRIKSSYNGVFLLVWLKIKGGGSVCVHSVTVRSHLIS